MTARQVRRSPKPRQKWSRRQIEALGTRTDLPTAGSILAGLSETSSRELWRRGEFPVPVLAVGRRLVVPVQPILDLLGISDGGEQNRSHSHSQPATRSGERRVNSEPGHERRIIGRRP